MALFNNAAYETRRTLKSGEMEISERAFNLIIGAVLMWGFLLNYIIVKCFAQQVVDLVNGTNLLLFLAGYIVLVIVGSVLIGKSSPVASFIGYNLIALPLGIVVCTAVVGIDPAVVSEAILLTAIVTLSFMIAATIFPGFFLSMGRALLFSVIICFLGFLVSTLIFGTSMMYEWIFAAIFGLYIGFDWARANTCARTVDNAIDLAAALYVDIINLFLKILRLMNKYKSKD